MRAHFNHICAYLGQDPLGDPHGRYFVVQALPWAGTVKTVEELGGKWAPAANYGTSIVKSYLAPLLATADPGGQEPVEPEPPEPEPVEPDPAPDPEVPGTLMALLRAVFDLLRKLFEE